MLAISAITSPSALAAGTYDGVWTTAALPNSYFIVYQNGTQLLAVELHADKYWNAYLGTLSGSSSTFSSLISSVSLNATITFSSATAASLTINSCVPVSAACTLPAGTRATINKIF